MGQVFIEGRGHGRNIRYVGLPLPKLPAVLKEAQIEGLMRCAHIWLKRTAPGHFDMAAYTKYGGREENVFEWRTKSSRRFTGKYGVPGQIKLGRNFVDPMVWTGNLRRAFLTGGMTLRGGTSGGAVVVKVSWPALPRYTYYTKYGKLSKEGPRMYRELTIMTEGEEKDLAEVFSKRMQKVLDQQGE